MSDILCVTNRSLCAEDFLTRIEKTAKAHPRAIILREKDLSEEEYTALAKKVLEICKKENTLCILHSFVNSAKSLDSKAIHLPLNILRSLTSEEKSYFDTIGASCHSISDAEEAQKLGCTYITAGHIFDTSCKAGLPGRGLDFLKDICKSVSVPVYAIGGIAPENIKEIRKCKAAGACVMSGAMTCGNSKNYFAAFEEN